MQIAVAQTGDTAELVVHYLDDEYQKIVKPNRLFFVPNYFTEYWLHRLGPTFSWIVVSLQQAAWRANDDHCTISQSLIADEVGIHRHTVARELAENPWRAWHIPEVEYQKGIVDKNGTYHPMPNKYGLYDPTPLIPEHLSGLYAYLQTACAEHNQAEVQKILDHLLGLKAREALALLEQYAQETEQKFEAPLSVKNVVEMATSLNIEALPEAKAQAFKQQCSDLQIHLTNIGKTICRQYFRLEWVPRLGPALAWLVMICRSRCFYNHETDELRDTYVWQKKDLVALLGQSNSNLRYLLSHSYAAHFVQILDQQRHKLTIQVALAREPLTTETAAEFWKQPQDSQNFDITTPQDSQNFDITTPQDSQNFDITTQKTRNFSTSPPEDSQFFDTYKYYKESVLNVVEKDEILIQVDNGFGTNQIKDKLREILIAADLTGRGLDNLLNQTPPLDLITTKAVILYAQTKNLGPGYIYRCLESNAPVDELFLQIAALNEETLTLFRQAVAELKMDGTLAPKLQTPIPPHRVALFTRFAQVFAGVEPATVAAALSCSQPGLDRAEVRPESAEQGDLELLWKQATEQLRLQMTQSTFDTWLKQTRLLARDGPNFTVAVSSDFAKDWLENRLYATIQRVVANLVKAANDLGQPEVKLKFVVTTGD